MRVQLAGCCGIKELIGINEINFHPETFLKNAIENTMSLHMCTRDNGCEYLGHAFFSVAFGPAEYQKGVEKNITQLAEYIRKKRLGRLHLTPVRINKIHNSKIIMGVWSPHTDTLKKWAEKVGIPNKINFNNGWS